MTPPHEDGIFHAWVLDQEDTWVDVFGREHYMPGMDRDYRENVLLFLLRGARHYQRVYMRTQEGISIATLNSGEARQKFYTIDEHCAQRWMLRTTFVKALMDSLAA